MKEDGAGAAQEEWSAVAFCVMSANRSIRTCPDTFSEPEGVATAVVIVDCIVSCCAFATSVSEGGMLPSVCMSVTYVLSDPPEFNSACTFSTIARAAAIVVEAVDTLSSAGWISIVRAVRAAFI